MDNYIENTEAKVFMKKLEDKKILIDEFKNSDLAKVMKKNFRC